MYCIPSSVVSNHRITMIAFYHWSAIFSCWSLLLGTSISNDAQEIANSNHCPTSNGYYACRCVGSNPYWMVDDCEHAICRSSCSMIVTIIHVKSGFFIIGMGLSKPHHMRSTMKFVFLLAWLIDWVLAWYVIPYTAESHLSTNQNYITHVNGQVLTSVTFVVLVKTIR